MVNFEEETNEFFKFRKGMTQQQVIDEIKNQKRNPNLKLSIKEKTEAFTNLLFYTLFDENTPVDENIQLLGETFENLADLVCWIPETPCHKIWDDYLKMLPEILKKLNCDASAIAENDPAANSVEEVYLSYPGFYAIAIYRLSHEFYKFGLPLVPRLMTEYAHRLTGTDINPGATIGTPFFIDHATGVVIGETAVIKDNVKLYQGVTLGALYVDRELRSTKRHPTIEKNVTIYANATILGGETVVGENSVIGGNVWLTNSVPANSMVTHHPQIKIKNTVKNE